MNLETQRALLERIDAYRNVGRGDVNTDVAAASLRLDAQRYRSETRHRTELELLSRHPQIVGLSGLVPEPGSYAPVRLGRVPAIVTRNYDGQVRAVANICRHRGAEIVAECGSARRLRCPYHGWTYHLDGSLAARRRERYFEDVEADSLIPLPCREEDGLIWVAGDPESVIADRPLVGAEVEVAPFGLERYRRVASTSFERPLNWKLAIDTFCEAYHVGALHTDTLDPLIHSDFALFDPFGAHGRAVAVRRSIDDLDSVARAERRLVPHATILWIVVPNTVLIYQQDHAQLYRSRPGDTPGRAVLDVEVYAPPLDEDDRSERYWIRNFELLVSVTDGEDFATAAGMQVSFDSGLLDTITVGRNEPALQHFHRSLDEALARLI